MIESMIMKDKEIVAALKNFKKEDMKKLDDIITNYMNIKYSSSIRTKAIDKAVDFINGKKFSAMELDEMFYVLNDIQDDIAQFSDELNINSDIKVALFLTVDEIENELNERGFEL
jgi:hypothetical protein